MGTIKVLSQHLVNKIAAGEVVERPASVVKELMENSLDAGAGQITLEVEQGGSKLIRLSDDGCGMDGEDIRLVIHPHATSKIIDDEDLYAINTLGFRGEAMASIASVSQMEIISRGGDSIEGWRLEAKGSQQSEPQPTAAPPGTTISVRNLFFNTPARRKFLRTTNTEMGHVTEHFSRIALAHCQVQFILIHNGRKIHELPKNQSLGDRIAMLFSHDLADGLIPVGLSDRGVEISGLAGRPQQSRVGAKWQYIFLNNRYIRDRFVSHAVREAYRGMLEINRQPIVFLFIKMDPKAVDVNVHPTKIEVRFADSNVIHSQVLAAIRNKLLSVDMAVPLSSEMVMGMNSQAIASGGEAGETDQSGENPQERKERIRSAMADFFKSNPPKNPPQSYPPTPQRPTTHAGAMQSGAYKNGHPSSAGYSEPPAVAPTLTPQSPDQSLDNRTFQNTAGPFVQIHNSYIVEQSDDGLLIVDQHALHERIIYEELNRRLNEGPLASQRFLIPEVVDVTPEQMTAIESQSEMLEQLGISLEQFGPTSVAVQAFPTLMEKVNPGEFVADLLDMISEQGGNLTREELTHSVIDMIACKAAVKAGDQLSESEIANLLAQRELVERAGNCPHGRPTTVKLSLAELEKLFKRT